MKTYIAILIGIVVLTGVTFGGYKIIKNKRVVKVVSAENVIRMKEVTGQVMREFEGQNVVDYSFQIPETATSTLDMDNALIKITDNNNPYATIYISYEGARGFAPVDYIGQVVAPHVSVIDMGDIKKIGDHDWQTAETEGSEWHVAGAANDQWLIIVENKKAVSDTVVKTLESFKAK
ncbi:TPA: hypothetical protein DEP94_01690 [Candidatus Nomurabacteria bacterium]|nr:hypothetical protein [Candidatus Nomurabacteria bacterium]